MALHADVHALLTTTVVRAPLAAARHIEGVTDRLVIGIAGDHADELLGYRAAGGVLKLLGLATLHAFATLAPLAFLKVFQEALCATQLILKIGHLPLQTPSRIGSARR